MNNDYRLSSKDLNVLFEKIRGKAEEALVKTAAIRSMAKAAYSTQNIGHFGLAFPFYTHFTSPIRRYPDVLVHRLLKKYLAGGKLPADELQRLEAAAAHCSKKEIEAQEAERDSVKLKQAEYWADRIGKVCEGTVSGVAEWGIYVEEKETKAEGLLKLRDLQDDFFILERKNYRFVGERTGRKITVGDKIKVKIAGADAERKIIDLLPA